LPTVLTARRHKLQPRMTDDKTVIVAYPASVVHTLFEADIHNKIYSRHFIETSFLGEENTPMFTDRVVLHHTIKALEDRLYHLQRLYAGLSHEATKTFAETKRVMREHTEIGKEIRKLGSSGENADTTEEDA
jgi:hypothetical protein